MTEPLPIPAELPTLPPRRTRGRPRRDASRANGLSTRDAILQAATWLMADRGYDQTTLADIALGAGVTPGSIYSHFSGKGQILVEVVRQTLERVSFSSRGADAEPATPAMLRAFAAWLAAPTQRAIRSLIIELHVVAARNPDVQVMVDEFHETEVHAIAAVLRQWDDEGTVVLGLDPVEAARLFLVWGIGLCHADTHLAGLSDAERTAIVHAGVDRLLLGPPQPAAAGRRSARQRAASR